MAPLPEVRRQPARAFALRPARAARSTACGKRGGGQSLGGRAMADAQSAGLGRRLLSVVYEALLLAALLIAASLPVAVATAGMSRELARPLFQLFLVGLAGLYFTWQWTG